MCLHNNDSQIIDKHAAFRVVNNYADVLITLLIARVWPNKLMWKKMV